MRRPICSRDISSENTPIEYSRSFVFALSGIAIDSAIFIMNEVFPIDGLAARITRSDRWNPDVISSKRS